MKYKVTLNNKVYEVEVEEGQAMLLDEYELAAPAPAAQTTAQTGAAPAAGTAAATTAAAQPGTQGTAQAAQQTSSLGLAAGEAVKAPMPGNILKINVSLGQQVEEGDVVIILEAMKMENEVVATKSGTIAQIVVDKGAVVETGAPLVVIA